MRPQKPVGRTRSKSGRVALGLLMFFGALAWMIGPARASSMVVSGWVLDSDGSVVPFGDAPDLGDSFASGTAVSLVANSTNSGYWVLWASGQVSTHGDVTHYGDLRNFALNRPAISLSVLPDESGYVILAADGGVFTFGSAIFHGSVPGVSLEAAANTTAVAIQLTSAGYRIIHHDGGVFAFGNATFEGSIPGVLRGASLDQPVVDAITDTNGLTYAMIAADGGVFAFGLSFSGSLGGTGRTDIVGAADDRLGGYALVDEAGTVHWFGNSQKMTIEVAGIADAADMAIAEVKEQVPATTTTSTTTTTTTAAPTTTTSTTTTTTSSTTTSTTTADPTTTTTSAPTTTGAPPNGAVVIWAPHTESAGPDNYFTPAFNDQGNWLSPNLTSGNAVLTLAITDKPTSRDIDVQVCAWTFINGRDFAGGFHETCSGQTRFTDETEGDVIIDLGPPEDWWQLNGQYPWGTGPDIMRIIVKDAATHSLMMATLCGPSCYSGAGSVQTHVPIAMTASLTFNN